MKKRNMGLVYVWICLTMAIILGVIANIRLDIIDTKKDCYITERTEKIEFGRYSLPRDFELSAEILCEDGLDIEKYKYLEKQTIFNCLDLIDGHCSGENKICMVRYEEEICK